MSSALILFDEDVKLPDGIIVPAGWDFQTRDLEAYNEYKITKDGQLVITYDRPADKDMYELLTNTFVLEVCVDDTPCRLQGIPTQKALRYNFQSELHDYDLHFENGILTYIFCHQTEQRVPFKRVT